MEARRPDAGGRGKAGGRRFLAGPAGAPGPACEVILHNPNRYPEAAARRLRPWLAALAAELVAAGTAPGASRRPGSGGAVRRAAGELPNLGVRFAGDRELRRVNRAYRGRDETTDVLSFPGEPPLGDILISVPAARRQAAAAGHRVERELRILLLHGLLHCLGFDHETDGGEMERLERRLRRRWLAVEVEAP